MNEQKIIQAYEMAKERYAAIGVDTDKAIEQLEKQLNKVIPVIKVRTYAEGDYISRELSLIKVNSPTNKRLDNT